jgi:hypothetical protein
MLRALPLVLALAAFAAGLGGRFVLDDLPTIVDNPVVRGDVPASAAFARNAWGLPPGDGPPSYRPLPMLMYRAERALFGFSPLAFHADSLLLYLALIALGQAIAAVWLGEAAACAAASLFAVMPIHVEAVASIVGRSETLALLFELIALALLLPLTRGERASPLRIAGAALAFAAALLCKESAVMFPLVIALLVATQKGRARWIAPLVLLGVLAIYADARTRLMPPAGAEVGDDLLAVASWPQRIAIALELVTGYGRLMVAPVDLCTGRKYAELALPDARDLPAILAGAALLAAAAWWTVRDLRRDRRPLIGCALALGFVFSSLPIRLPELMADRFMLGPSWFLCLAAGALAAKWIDRDPVRLAIVGLAVAAQAAACVFYCRVWRNDLTLFSHATVACPRSVHNRLRYGESLARAGASEEAVWQLALAAEGRRRFPERWQPPDSEAPIAERLRSLPRLDALARYLDGRGFHREAAIARTAASSAPATPDTPARSDTAR